ncbi:MAG: hypothetical protein K2X82_12030 [Gemmataceae bacterium]|nr:hypothetical protein [Gemmataceae bacterium]
MPFRPLVPVVLALLAAPGCLHHRGDRADRRVPAECGDEPVVRVKAPPQKIVVELPENCPPGKDKEEKAEAPGKPESARRQPERGAPESAPAGQPESALGAIAAASQGLALANQIAGFSRTSALTSSLGTVNPGSAGLGIGVRWIHIPVPFPRLFSIQETPSVTVPLSEANLMHGGMAGHGLVGGAGRGGITREELAALIEQEIAVRNRAAARKETAPAVDDEEKKRLEKKLAAAEAQIERLNKALDTLDEKLSPKK